MDWHVSCLWAFLVTIFMKCIQAEELAAGQCLDNKSYLKNRFMKSIEYRHSEENMTLLIMNFQYDSETGDFFYIGEANNYYTDSDYSDSYEDRDMEFLCRTSIAGKIIWATKLKIFADYKSLLLLPTLESVFHSTYSSYKFRLIFMNSSDGTYQESYEFSLGGGSLSSELCAVTDDESALFCLVGNAGSYPFLTVIRYDFRFKQVNKIRYSSLFKHSRHLDLKAINSYEVFFTGYINKSREMTYHFVKGIFNFTHDKFKEGYHQSIQSNSHDDSVKLAIDEKGETIWYAVELNDTNIMYQQNNFSDFSLIGNKYVYTDSMRLDHSGIKKIDIMDEVLYMLFYSSRMYLFATIDTSTQKVIKVYETLSFYEYYHRDLLARNGYISIFNFRTFGKKFSVHNQVKSGSNIDFLPRYKEINNVTFQLTTNSSFDFKNESLRLASVSNYNHTVYSNNTDNGTTEIKISKVNSYFISLPDSFEQEFRVGSNQTVSKDINLPCFIEFGKLSYTILDGKSSKKLDWVTIDYSTFKISMNAPEVNEATKFSFVVSTKYLDGSLNSTISIVVTPCTAIKHCQECSTGICTTCEYGYMLSSDSKSCELRKDDHVSSPPINSTNLPSVNSTNPPSVNLTNPPSVNLTNPPSENLTTEVPIPENSTIYEPNHNAPNATDKDPEIQDSSTSDFDKIHSSFKFRRYAIFTALALGILLGFANGFLFDKSFLQDVWSITHQMQMMLLLTLINSNAKNEVENLILDCSFSAFSIFLFPVKIFKSVPLIKQLYTVKPDQHLLDLNATTGSTVISCILLPLMLMVLAIVILLSFCLCTQQKRETLRKYIMKIFLRILIETFIFVMIASTLEIKNYNENGSIFSILFTLLMLMCEAIFTIIVFLSWKRHSKMQEIDQDSYSSELYVGIISVSQRQNLNNEQEDNKSEDNESENEEPDDHAEVPNQVIMARLYTSVFLIRRLLMVLIFVFIPESYNSYKILSSITLQVVYVIYLAKFSCFERVKDKIYEIVNEIMYLNFIVMFFVILNKSEYSNMELTLLNAILFQSLFLFAGSLYTCIKAAICKRKIDHQQNVQADQDDVEIHNFDFIRSSSSDDDSKTTDGMTLNRAKAIHSVNINFGHLSKSKDTPKEENKDNESMTLKPDSA